MHSVEQDKTVAPNNCNNYLETKGRVRWGKISQGVK
jgi:hypothetical protein